MIKEFSQSVREVSYFLEWQQFNLKDTLLFCLDNRSNLPLRIISCILIEIEELAYTKYCTDIPKLWKFTVLITITFKCLVLKNQMLSASSVWQQKILFWSYYIYPLVYDSSRHTPTLLIHFLAVYVKLDAICQVLNLSSFIH